LRYVHELVTHPDWAPSNGPVATDEESPLTQAMAAARRVTHPGSLVIVISDFIGLSRNAQSYLTGVARHNEVLVIFLSDPLERRLPPPGRYRLVHNDAEMAIDTYARGARSDYRHLFEDRLAVMDKLCQRYGIHLLHLSTEDDPIQTLQQALARRVN
jgi:uncharacterized protein (DUF58 family)